MISGQEMIQVPIDEVDVGKETVQVPVKEVVEGDDKRIVPKAHEKVAQHPPPDIIDSTQISSSVSKNIKTNNSKLQRGTAQPVIAVGKTPSSPSWTSLIQDYNSIRNMMEIPDEEYQTALQFLETLQTLLPSCQLVLYRDWYLKLKSTTRLNVLTIFADHSRKKIIFNLNVQTRLV